MECKNWSYAEFPELEEIPADAHVIATTGDEFGTRYMHDVVYLKTPEGDLKLQILIPLSRNATPAPELPFLMDKDGNFPPGHFDNNPQYPCIVYVQGSAWMPQNVYGSAAMAGKLAERGIVVAIVEYRDSRRAIYPTPILDTMNAVRFMKKNAKRYCVDPEKVVVAGNSSGGHTAMMAGIWHKVDKGDNYYPEYTSEVRGIINLYGSTDFTFDDSNPSTPSHCTADSPEGMEMGCRQQGLDAMTPEMIQELTCRTHITPDTDMAPCLIIHGTKDRTVNAMCSVYLYQKLKECGKEAELYLIQGADHGQAEFFMPEVLDVIEAFVRKVTA